MNPAPYINSVDSAQLNTLVSSNTSSHFYFEIELDEFRKCIDINSNFKKSQIIGCYFNLIIENRIASLEISQFIYSKKNGYERLLPASIVSSCSFASNEVATVSNNGQIDSLFSVNELDFVMNGSSKFRVSIATVDFGDTSFQSTTESLYYTLKIEGDNNSADPNNPGTIPAIICAAPCPPVWVNPSMYIVPGKGNNVAYLNYMLNYTTVYKNVVTLKLESQQA